MLKKISYIVCGLLAFLILQFSLNINASMDEINIDFSTNRMLLNIENNHIEIQMSEIKKYEIKYEGIDNSINYAYVDKEERISFIVSKNLEKSDFFIKILLYQKKIDNYITAFQPLKKKYYEVLTENSEVVRCDSLIEKQYVSDAYLFGKYHKYSSNSTIENFSLDRNTKTIQEMTESDSYLDSYFSTYSPYQYALSTKKFHDRIINIIPESWFYDIGKSHCYLGKEYGVYTKTYQDHHDLLVSKCYKTEVTIWDFESSLPGLSKNMNNDLYFSVDTDFSLNIKPLIHGLYIGFKRNDVGNLYWTKYFDTSEDSIILRSNEEKDEEFQYEKIYIAPKSLSFAVGNDEQYCCPEDHKISIEKFKYELDVESSLNDKLNDIQLKNYAFQTINNLVGKIEPKVAVVTKILKALSDMSTTILKDDLKNKDCDLRQNVLSKNTIIDYTGNNTGSPLELIINNFTSFNKIFQNKLFKDYNQKITVEIGIPSYCQKKCDFFSFVDYGYFNLYNSKGELIIINGDSNILRKAFYHGLSDFYGTRSSDDLKKVMTKSTFDVSVVKCNTLSILPLTPYKTGNYEFINSNSRMKIEIYDENGNFISCSRKNDFENSCCAYLEQDKVYIIKNIMFDNNEIGQGKITITELPGMKRISQTLTFNILGSQSYVTYIPAYLFKAGEYRFSTSTNTDTTIRLFDEKGRLLAESYDPNADWSEDAPDLNANLTFGINSNKEYYDEYFMKIVIIEVSNLEKIDFVLHVSFREI